MKIFACPSCARPVYFHNLSCLCGADLAFDPASGSFALLDAPCSNRSTAGCNWQAPAPDAPCQSCAMTRTIPDQTLPQNQGYWSEAELAKRWVLWGLMQWGWFGPGDPGPAPVFDMIAEETGQARILVLMGHDDGTIVINVTEADAAQLTARQIELGELHRSMIGHMRHEISHFLHWRLVQDAAFAESFRALFGDERADYGEALSRHYESPQPGGDQHITSYATAHPHEDWAETAAHLMHHIDIVDSFDAAGLSVTAGPAPGVPAYVGTDTEQVLARSAEITLALNHMNRSMGLADLYPFVLSVPVREKLAFAHRSLNRHAAPTGFLG